MAIVSWKFNNYFKADATKCYEEMQELEEVTPENVLEYASDESSELHKCFEWNDSIAANKYRLQQARSVIQYLVVTDEKKEREPVRVFQITSQPNVYQTTRFFLEQPDEYEALLKRAKEELAAFKKRYKSLTELETVFEAIDML